MSKVLLLSGHDIDVLKNSNINADICDVYKKGFLSKMTKKSKYCIRYSFENWIKAIILYDIIIIFDTYYNKGMIDCIYQRNPKIKIIFYCWNTIKTIQQRVDIIPLFEDKRVEMWSYNINDCEKYGMMYNPQFWNSKLIPVLTKNDIDVSFIGSPKRRINLLREISEYCDKNNLNTYFYLTNYSCDFNKNTEGKFLPYDEYITKIASNSKSILDLVTDDNYGLTLRPLEALFLKKKLITNYYDITREPFYNSNNIYLYGKENRSINEFLELTYIEISDDIINSYSCESWIQRFEKLSNSKPM